MSTSEQLKFEDDEANIPFDSAMFDPADPFAFLSALPPSSMSSPPSSSSATDSVSSASPPADWSQFSTLWDPDLDATVQPSPSAPSTLKSSDHTSPFDLFSSLPMDLDTFDFTPETGLSLPPAALHFDPKLLDPKLLDPKVIGSFLAPTPRRLSVTSSSSSSGASLSPIADFAAPVSPASLSDVPATPLDPASELAQRVRLAAGVTLAVPAHAALQASAHALKLPLPRLPAANSSPPSSSSAGSSPQPAPPSPSPQASTSTATAAAASVSDSAQGPTGRTKTSHTTIERRYRTNLNARIQGLKDAVPALRVLERRKERERLGQPWASAPASSSPDDEDAVDARGYADGVKVARKISKANVLGKAAEYIRVLKRREARLLREQDGLRALVGGLVGGPALLKEWEAAWTARFGGPERDELEYEGMSDDEGDDEDDEDEDDGGGRARKRAKVAATATAPAKEKKERKPPAAAPAPGEKRKRGRPRKLPDAAPPTGAAPTAAAVPPPVVAQPQQSQGAQYLLAAFAFLSFFNMPSRSSSYQPPHPHTHTGTVLSPAPKVVAVDPGMDLVGTFHLLVSALVFFSIVLPWVPRARWDSATKLVRRLRAPVASSATSSSSASAALTAARRLDSNKEGKARDAFNRLALLDALAPSARGTPDEPARLRAALGVYAGLTGMLIRIFGKISRGRRADRGIERLQLEQRAWVRLGERAALDANVHFGDRIQAYIGMLSHTPAFGASPTDLTTLALLLCPFAPIRAAKLWTRARDARVVRPHERAVLDKLDVAGAAMLLRSADSAHISTMSPLGALSVLCARANARRAAERMFVGAARDELVPPTPALIDVLRALGGREAVLGCALERLSEVRSVTVEEAEAIVGTLQSSEAEVEEVVLGAAARVRALSTGLGGEECGRRLRRVLAESAFEGGEVEEARDIVVDMVVERERRARGRSVA